MTDPHVHEDEQVERLKEWWKRNGVSVIAGAAIGIGAVVGWNLWTSHKETTAETASGIYEEMMIREGTGNPTAAADFGGQLMDDYPETPYASKAALFLARLSVEGKDFDSAQSQLQWAIDNAKDAATVHTARVRLGSVLIAAGKHADVPGLFSAVTDMGDFESRYKEIEGDSWVAAGDFDKASSVYQESLNVLAPNSGHRNLLQLKLSDAQAN